MTTKFFDLHHHYPPSMNLGLEEARPQRIIQEQRKGPISVCIARGRYSGMLWSCWLLKDTILILLLIGFIQFMVGEDQIQWLSRCCFKIERRGLIDCDWIWLVVAYYCLTGPRRGGIGGRKWPPPPTLVGVRHHPIFQLCGMDSFIIFSLF